MNMKKSFLLLTAVAFLGLAGCQGGGKTPVDPPEPPGPVDPETPEFPTEEGKTLFYFELGEETPEIPEYVGIYLTGKFAEWKTAPNEAVEMHRFEETEYYYGVFNGKASDFETNEYQLTLGYTATSGAPSTGVNWGYKSLECQAGSGDSGMDNLSFEVSEDGLSANLGKHSFSEVPGPVVIVENVTFSITLAEALPEYVALYAPGDYKNGWACNPEQDKMTPSEDRKTWSMTIDKVAVNTYNLKILAEYADCEAFSWGTVVLDDGEGGNYSLMVLRKHENATININEEEEVEAYTVDLTKLPDPSTLVSAELSISVTFEGTLPEGFPTEWWVSGTLNAWDHANANGIKFVWDEEDSNLMVLTMEINEGEYEFGILASASWAPCIKSAKGENLTITVPAEGLDVAYTVEEDQLDVIMDNGEAKVKGDEVPPAETKEVEIVITKANSTLETTAAAEDVEVTIDGFTFVLGAGFQNNGKYDEFGGPEGVKIKNAAGSELVVKKVYIDNYKFDNYKMLVDGEPVAGAVTEKEGTQSSSLVREFDVNSTEFEFVNTYTGTSWIHALTFVVEMPVVAAE